MLDKKPVNLEAEKQRALMEREQLVGEFEANFIYSADNNYRNNIKVKSYVDGSKYEGQGKHESHLSYLVHEVILL